MKTLVRFITVISFIFIGLFSSDNFANNEYPVEDINDLKNKISSILASHNVPGAAIAMVDKNGPIWVGALGLSNKEFNIQADENTLFRAGSTSKLFVGLSILKLVEENKLNLTDKVHDLIPDIQFKNPWHISNPIQVVHLLEHTTGWDDVHLVEMAHLDPNVVTLKNGLDFHPHSRVSRWQPGTRMSYSNSGVAVAAYIIEKITGMTYENYVEQTFFIPLEMSKSTFLLNDDVKNYGATLYKGGIQPQDYRHIIFRPSGALNTSAADLSKLLTFFIQRGEFNNKTLLKADSLQRMETITSTSAAQEGQKLGYGLTNYLKPYKQYQYRQHNGAIHGGLSNFSYLPEFQLGHAVMLNADNFSAMAEISNAISEYETSQLPKYIVEPEMEINKHHKSIEGYYYKINARSALFEFTNIFQIQVLEFSGNQLISRSLFGSKKVGYYPVSNTMYKSVESGVTSLTKTIDPIAGPVVHSGISVLKPINLFHLIVIVLIFISWLASILITFIYGLYRGVKYLIKDSSEVIQVTDKAWSFFASLSIIGTSFAIIFTSNMMTLASPSLSSISIMLMTLGYGVFSAIALYSNISSGLKNGWHTTNKVFAIASFFQFIVAVYLLNYGMIGLRIWA